MKLANENVYNLYGLGHLKLANNSRFSYFVALLWDLCPLKLANENVYNLYGLGDLKLANNS